MIEDLLHQSTFEEAQEKLLACGWSHIGTSNWCEVFADEETGQAARLSPFDPTQVMFARLCIDMAGNRWTPRVDAIIPMTGGGEAVLMEQLWPAPHASTEALVAAIDIPNDNGFKKPPPSDELSRFEPHVLALRTALRRLMASGKEHYRVWGGSDIREGKIMTDDEGNPKLTDPAYLSGPKLKQAIFRRDVETLAGFSKAEIRNFLRLPYFGKTMDRQHERVTLAPLVEQLDLPEGFGR